MSQLQVQDEMILNAPLKDIWAVITDIKLLPKVNPGVVKATGSMNKQGDVRVCSIENGRRKGATRERLTELVPGKSTVWKLETDSMGMNKMMKDVTYRFELKDLGGGKTRVINQSYYQPANAVVRVMNPLVMKRMFSRIQRQILQNIKNLVEKP